MMHFPQLVEQQARLVERIFQAALAAADPRDAVRKALLEMRCSEEPFSGLLNPSQRVRVFGVGKAAQAMAQGVLDVLGDQVTEGCLITKHVQPGALPDRVRVLPGNHPVPGVDSVQSTREFMRFIQNGRADDGNICLISGGGSALMAAPPEGIRLEDLQKLTRLLLACGAEIGEINTLRKHLDQLKGGGLARLAAPAHLLTLILSDVIGSPMDVIASGPTVADVRTYADGFAVLQKYDLLSQIPPAIRDHFQRGMRGEVAETPKPGDLLFAHVTNQIVASNAQACQAAVAQAAAEGFNAMLLTTYLQGEAAPTGAALASILHEIHASGHPLKRPACVVCGGETTVTLRGAGQGGRNQELALGAAALLDGLPDVALITLATDGEDGPTDAAGALVTGQTWTRARALKMDPAVYLTANDSYRFFASLGDLLQTGPTGTNVNDITFLFAF